LNVEGELELPNALQTCLFVLQSEVIPAQCFWKKKKNSKCGRNYNVCLF